MSSKTAGLEDQTVVIIGRPSGIAGAIVSATHDAGAHAAIAAPARPRASLRDDSRVAQHSSPR